MVYPALLPLMRTPRLPVVDWTDTPRRFKWIRPFRRKTKSGICACAITFQLASITQTFSYIERIYHRFHLRIRFNRGVVTKFNGTVMPNLLPDWTVGYFNVLTPNDRYRGQPHRQPLNVTFYIFIQQIQELNILNMVYTLHFFPFKMQFVS